MARKATTEPSFDAYLSNLGTDQPIELVLLGHLVIEALLVEIIQLSEHSEKPWRWNFPKKLDYVETKGLLPSPHRQFYERLNDIRNDFAHMLGHRLTFDEVFKLAQDLAAAGYDFSDSTLHTHRERSEEWYGCDGALTEVIMELYYELTEILATNGGPDRRGG